MIPKEFPANIPVSCWVEEGFFIFVPACDDSFCPLMTCTSQPLYI